MRTFLSPAGDAEFKASIPILGVSGAVLQEADGSLSWYAETDARQQNPIYRAFMQRGNSCTWIFPVSKNGKGYPDDEGPEEWRALVALLL